MSLPVGVTEVVDKVSRIRFCGRHLWRRTDVEDTSLRIRHLWYSPCLFAKTYAAHYIKS